ncbi:MAG: hypothetical protein BWY90_00109 [Deltaproteobacteria bacterium ADurb.BinA014]|nr:MAG: hypothetical protein BWY90_00109 [Deltaproteobacteria bacterium ADurb.BinA014]
MKWDYIVYGYGLDPAPLEQLEGIRAEVRYSGGINGAALSDVLTCLIGHYAEIEKIRALVEAQNNRLDELAALVKVVQGYRSKKDIPTATIATTTTEGRDAIRRPGAAATKKK